MNLWLSRIKGLFAIPAACSHGLVHGRAFLQADGTTDLSRVLGCFTILAFLAYEGYGLIVLKQPFNGTDFGAGAAATLSAAAVFILAHNFASR